MKAHLMPKVKVSKRDMWEAIKWKCIDCMGHENYRRRIRDCDSNATCALWKLRPYQPK